MPAADAEQYLIQAVRGGDQRAWRDVIERYEGRLVRFARRMLAQPAEAEDLVQETFLGFLRSLDRFDGSRSLETYLFAILRNKLHDHFRRVQRQPNQRQSLDTLGMDEADSAWLAPESPSRHAQQSEALASQRAALVQSLREWVRTIREQRRFQELMVVEMLLVVGMRNKEVAADLGLTETAVAGVKFRVLERWKQLTQAAETRHDWSDADLSQDSTIAAIWREEGVSCLKRSTLGRFLLGALDDDWTRYIDFHVNGAACLRCQANLDDLEAEEADHAQQQRAEQYFASSVGFLSRVNDAGDT